MDFIGSFGIALTGLIPMIIIFLILMDGYRTRLNSVKIVAQNEEMIELLKEIKNQTSYTK